MNSREISNKLGESGRMEGIRLLSILGSKKILWRRKGDLWGKLIEVKTKKIEIHEINGIHFAIFFIF